MRVKNIHVHIDAPIGSGKYELARVIKQCLEERGAHVEIQYPQDYMQRDEALGFSETSVFIDMRTPRSFETQF